MRKPIVVVIMAGLLWLGGAARTAGAATDWTPMTWLVGSWTCTGTSNLGGHMTRIKATLVGRLDLDGAWLALRGEAAKTKDVPSPPKFQVYLSWNAATRRWETYVFDSGGTVEQASTPGFDAGSAAWTGTIHAGSAQYDVVEAWEQKSDKELRWSGSVAKQPAWDWTCKKR